MLLAALGDIHGNIHGLNRAIQIIDDLGIQLILNTGDVVNGQPFPNEVIELVQQRDMKTVQGLHDRYVGLLERKRSRWREKIPHEQQTILETTHRMLHLEYVEWLRNLPRRWRGTAENIDMFLAHGSPESPVESIPADAHENRFLRAREVANARLIVLGMTHHPFARQIADTLFVNPGALGVPSDEKPAGTFALINTDSDPWEVEFREIPLD